MVLHLPGNPLAMWPTRWYLAGTPHNMGTLVRVSCDQLVSKTLVSHEQDSGEGAFPETKELFQKCQKNPRAIPDSQHM